MRIKSVYEAAMWGTYQQFTDFFDGNINEIDKESGFTLLIASMVNQEMLTDKMEIIRFLLDNGADVNLFSQFEHQNALHVLFLSSETPNVDYLMTVVEQLVERGIDINARDKDGAVPIKYLVTNDFLPLHENDVLYRYLLDHGANPYLKDVSGKSPVDYAKKLQFRSDFLDVVSEYEANGN